MVAEVRQLRGKLDVNKEKKTVITADNGYFSVENISEKGKVIEPLIAHSHDNK
jgi:hypothetical protein